MKKNILFGISLFIIGILCSSSSSASEQSCPQTDTKSILENAILQSIHHLHEIEGLTPEGLSPDEVSTLKTKMVEAWNTLTKEGILKVSGPDKEIRPYFVNLQSTVEFLLAAELGSSIKELTGFIHTPMPATPLCARGEISKDLVHPSLESDLARLSTIKSRMTILRLYLNWGGTLYVAYPKNGLAKRTEEQQKIYAEELIKYSPFLIDLPLTCEEIPSDLIGATYYWMDQMGEKLGFAIQMTQANSPKDDTTFILWWGAVKDNDFLQDRLNTVTNYLWSKACRQLKVSRRKT